MGSILNAIGITIYVINGIFLAFLPILCGAAFAYSAEKNKKDEEKK